MLKQTITGLIREAVAGAQKAGKLPAVTLPDILIEKPQKAEYGDYASSISLKLARAVGMNPMAIAREIAALIKPSEEIESVNRRAARFYKLHA